MFPGRRRPAYMTRMDADPGFLAQLMRASLEVSPQARALGLAEVRIDAAEAAIRLPWREDLVGDPATGVIAGGAVTTLLDHVGGMAVWAALGRYLPVATLDLRIDYMRPARPGEALLGAARCYKLTHAIAFVRAAAYETDPDDPVAAAQAAYMLTAARPAPDAPAAAADAPR